MADAKISQLSSVTNPVSADMFAIVENATTTTKKITYGDLKTAISGYQAPTSGVVDGSNTIFAFTTAPNVLMVDGVVIRKVTSDSTVNWTGTTTVTLTIAPNFDIAGIA